MRVIKTTYCLLFLFLSTVISAQDTNSHPKRNIGVELIGHYGAVVKNWPDFPQRKGASLIEANLIKQCTGDKEWHAGYFYPQPGISLIVGSMGNHDILGETAALVPNFSLVTNRSSSWGMRLRIGVGVAYFNRTWNVNNNRDNLLIGSRFTNLGLLSFNIRRDISPKLSLHSGLSFIHFSNSHIQLPNVGINIPAFNLGINYFPNARPAILKNQPVTETHQKVLFNLRLGLGWHEFGDPVHPTGGPKYAIYTGSAYLSKRIGKIHNIQAGFHLSYYSSFYRFITSQEYYTSDLRKKSSTAIIFLGHEYMMGRLSFVTQLGFNLHNPFYRDFRSSTERGKSLKSLNSNRLGLHYYILDPTHSSKKNLYVSWFVKTNLGQADFGEVGFGYTF